jgi:hypothetical protein
MSDVTKGFRDGRFLYLSERDQRDVLPPRCTAGRRACVAALLPRRPRMATSLERLDGECGEELRRTGLPIKETSSRASRPAYPRTALARPSEAGGIRDGGEWKAAVTPRDDKRSSRGRRSPSAPASQRNLDHCYSFSEG